MSLPLRMPWNLASDRWATDINPVLNFAPNQGILITNQTLKAGTNVINHLLGKTQQGWIITDQNAVASLYRSQPFNSTTLTLVSNNPVTISLWCY